MSTINNISLRTYGEQQLERAKWCVPSYVSLMVSVTIFSGFCFSATVLQTVIASFCALGLGFWHGFAEKFRIEKEAFVILAQSDLYHLLEVKAIKPETEERHLSKAPSSQPAEVVRTEEKPVETVETAPEKVVTEVKKSSVGFKGKNKKQAQQTPRATTNKKNR